MTAREIQSLRATQPFEPFRVLLADGRHFDIRRAENFTMTGNGRLLCIAMPDHFVTVDLHLITEVQTPIPSKRNGSSRKCP